MILNIFFQTWTYFLTIFDITFEHSPCKTTNINFHIITQWTLWNRFNSNKGISIERLLEYLSIDILWLLSFCLFNFIVNYRTKFFSVILSFAESPWSSSQSFIHESIGKTCVKKEKKKSSWIIASTNFDVSKFHWLTGICIKYSLPSTEATTLMFLPSENATSFDTKLTRCSSGEGNWIIHRFHQICIWFISIFILPSSDTNLSFLKFKAAKFDAMWKSSTQAYIVRDRKEETELNIHENTLIMMWRKFIPFSSLHRGFFAWSSLIMCIAISWGFLFLSFCLLLEDKV